MNKAMTYDEAEKAMRSGAAVARRSWCGALYLFIDRERVWARYIAGRVHYCDHVRLQKNTATDWEIVENPRWPLVAPPPKKKSHGERSFARNLTQRQEAMKQRWRP